MSKRAALDFVMRGNAINTVQAEMGFDQRGSSGGSLKRACGIAGKRAHQYGTQYHELGAGRVCGAGRDGIRRGSTLPTRTAGRLPR